MDEKNTMACGMVYRNVRSMIWFMIGMMWSMVWLMVNGEVWCGIVYSIYDTWYITRYGMVTVWWYMEYGVKYGLAQQLKERCSTGMVHRCSVALLRYIVCNMVRHIVWYVVYNQVWCMLRYPIVYRDLY